MDTHSNKQDRNLFREESQFEVDIIKSRRDNIGPNKPLCNVGLHNKLSHPIVSTYIADIIAYLECKQIGDLSDALDNTIWEYKEAIHIIVGTTYPIKIYLDNHQEDLVEVWYKWIGCLYSYHPGVYRILTQLGIVDTDLYFSPQASHFCRENIIQSSEV